MAPSEAGTVDILDVGPGPIEYLDLPAAEGAAGTAPLVLLHEGLGSLGLWRGLPRALHAATGRRTVAYSRHGHGQSAAQRGSRAVDYMHVEAREVLPEVLDRLGVADPIFVGHSDGASIALIHAGTPGLAEVTGLVLYAPHVIVEDRSIAGIEEARETFLSTDLPERMGHHHADPAGMFWAWNDIWLAPAFRDWDIQDVLPQIDCPVLLVQGHDDQYGTLRQLDLIEQAVPGRVERVHLDDCGHAPHLERPDATLEATVAFVAALS